MADTAGGRPLGDICRCMLLECTDTFIKRFPNQWYCSRLCKSRANQKYIEPATELHKEVIPQGHIANGHRQAPNLRRLVVEILGGVCAKCGFSDFRALQVDHPNGGGSKHIRDISWSLRYRDILTNPQNFQLLCANCNWIKRAEQNEAKGRPRKV